MFVSNSWEQPGTRIIDGDSGKMLGQTHQADLSDFAIDPRGRYLYVAESIWTKGNRGTRQDLLVVYDARTLKLVREIAVPGRLLAGNRRNNLSISADGKYAYIYNFDPAASVIAVDLDKGRVQRDIETPGCGIAAALPAAKFLSLCANGSIAVSAVGGRPDSINQSAPFFSAESDPIFDSSPVDAATGTAVLLSYTGLLYIMKPGADLTPPEGWSIQEAAGISRATSAPMTVSWLPGGLQPIAINMASNRAYVLMHMGEHWTHKSAGSEIWVLDLAARKLVARRKLKEEAVAIQVSQDAQPLLFLSSEKNKLTILDAATFAVKHELDDVASGVLTTASVQK